MSLFQQLKQFPVSSIFAFIDETNKSFYMLYSINNSIHEISKTMTLLSRKQHGNAQLQASYDANTLDLFIIKDYDSPPLEQILRAEYTELVQKYVDAGYKNLRDNFIAIHYKLYRRVMGDFRNVNKKGSLFYVTARSKRADELLLGIFETEREADAWVEATYPGQPPHIVPKFALNELTKQYNLLYGLRIRYMKIKTKRRKRKLKNALEESKNTL